MHERRLGHCKAASRLVLLSPQLEDLFQFDPKKGPFIVLPVPAWVNVKQFSSGSRPGTHEYQSDVSGHSCMRTTFKVGHCVCRDTPTARGCENCKRDEGRSLGAGDQGPAPNHCELLALRALVGERRRKRREVKTCPGEIWRDERKRTIDDVPKSIGRCRNRGKVVAPGISLGGALKPGPSGIRLGGGVNPEQALCGTRELSLQC